MQPAAMTTWPSRLFSVTVRNSPTDSSTAACKKAHVLTITTSDSEGVAACSYPASDSRAPMPSLSTLFFSQPSVTILYFDDMKFLTIIGELQGYGQFFRFGLQVLDYLLEVVLA